MWTDDWIGIPYQEFGRGPEYDCLGLFVALQRYRHGRSIFDPVCSMKTAALQRLADRVRPNWRRVPAASEGSAVLFRVRGLALHVGYALDGRRMLHTSQDTGESVIENFHTPAWGDRLEGIYDYRG